MARTPSTKKRRRGWAWTLTITAALLAVVWVGSMKVAMGVQSPRFSAGFSVGLFGLTLYEPDLTSERSGVYLMATDGLEASWTSVGWNQKYGWGVHTISHWFAPLWPFVLLTGVPGVWMLVKSRMPSNPNACPACGYDRTGLPQTSTGPAPCPECGKTEGQAARREA